MNGVAGAICASFCSKVLLETISARRRIAVIQQQSDFRVVERCELENSVSADRPLIYPLDL